MLQLSLILRRSCRRRLFIHWFWHSEMRRHLLLLNERGKKDNDISRTEVELIKKQALDVPLELFNHSYKNIVILDEFLPKCSKNIISDAKVSIHLLCGSARAAFQTVLVNKPSVELTKDLQAKLKQIEKIESGLIQ
mmetsp:Transcript_11090/g.12643  ORF Transcript_11090/g.12643 Transcript_11090/m.12643 type:complete len:136 (-) Transcript_11090:178-585(-)